MKRQLLVFGLAVSAVALFVVTLTLAMAFALESDVDALSKRARAAARTEKTLRADVEAIKRNLAALSSESSAANPAEPASVAAAAKPNPAVPAHVPYAVDSPRMVKVTAVMAPAATSPECIFRSGDAERLADCIRSQQDKIADPRLRARYR